MSEKNLLVLKSSAGSGKTYALVKHYLLLCLRQESPSAYSHILAITFTNAAAAEMKERVLARLKEFAQDGGNTTPLFQEIQQSLNISPEELQARAARTLSHMLHHYSRIAISTIDSFTQRIVRAFARDLHLHPDFGINLKTSEFLEEVVDQLLAASEDNEELNKYLLEFVQSTLAEDGKWNIRQSLIDFSKEIIKEKSKAVVESSKQYTSADYVRFAKLLRTQMAELFDEPQRLAIGFKETLEKNKLTFKDLVNKGSGIEKLILLLAEGKIETAPGATFIKGPEGRWQSKSKPNPQVDAIADELSEYALPIIDLITPAFFRQMTLLNILRKNIFKVGLLGEIVNVAQQLKEQENILLISDFQEIIQDIVTKSPAPFIYEKAGERFHHILFDEFQDTSEMQFANFLPLIENALSTGHFNLIVGDAKQAIYRWRNGNAEQFVALPSVPDQGNSKRQPLFSDAFEEGKLVDNRRSAESIIHFNNALYTAMLADKPKLQPTYSSLVQNPFRTEKGFVKAQAIAGKKQSDYVPALLATIVKAVEESIADGYRPGDIAVLTRKGVKQGGVIAAHLIASGYRVVTQDSFLLSNSSSVRLIISSLHYLLDAEHHFSRFDIIRQLCQLKKEQFSFPSIANKYITPDRNKTNIRVEDFLHDHFPGFFELKMVHQNAYQLAEALITLYRIPTDSYMEFLLDHLNSLSNKKGKQLAQILDWWNENQDSLFIAESEDPDCIRIMTVHKSKGLQFPVVIYPRFIEKTTYDSVWVQIDPDRYYLPFAPIKPSNDRNSLFPELQHEADLSELDEINLAYVATTRPENRLYFMLPLEDSGLNKKLVQYFSQSEAVAENTWVYGEKEKAQQKKDTSTNHLKPPIAAIEVRHAMPYRTKKIHTEAQEWGEIVHAVLALIEKPGDQDRAIEKVIEDRFITDQSLQKKLRETIFELLNTPSFQRWFAGGQQYSEREIITETGEIIRPDRIVVFEDHLEVVDFKTGEDRSKYTEQVKLYMNYASALFNKPAKGYLAFTESLLVQEVGIND